MRFEEKEDVSIYVGIPNKIFVYFLLYNGEVVYVGQTKNGLSRPFSHKNKIFDEVKIIYCNEEDLDAIEKKYILKYSGKYNKELSYMVSYTMTRVRNSLEKNLDITIHLTDIKKIIKFLKIKLKIDSTIQKIVISSDDYLKLRDFIKIVLFNREIQNNQKCNNGYWLQVNEKEMIKALEVFDNES